MLLLVASLLVLPDLSAAYSDKCTLDGTYYADMSTVNCVNAEENDLMYAQRGNITNLNIFNSKFTRIKNSHFKNFPRLQKFDTDIVEFDHDAFNELVELIFLSISGNKLSYIDAYLFSNISLKQLTIGGNEDLSLPEGKPFLVSRTLIQLNISHCAISKISAETFQQLPSLTHLYMGSNDLRALPADVFKNNKHLERLQLQYNEFTTLSPAIFPASLTSVRLDDNPWTCDCHLVPLVLWCGANTRPCAKGRCQRLPSGESKDWRTFLATAKWEREWGRNSECPQLTFYDLCQTPIRAKWLDDYVSQSPSKTLLTNIVNCKDETVPGHMTCKKVEERDLFKAQGQNITNLIVSHSKITEIQSSLFKNFPKLTYLNAFNNNIEKIHRGAFDGLENLLRVYMSRNKITDIDADLFSDSDSIETFDMSHNVNLTVPEGKPFIISKSLNLLDISSCAILKVSTQTFENVPSLMVLHIERNLLTALPADVFQNNKQLGKVWLNNNKFTTLSPDIFSRIKSVHLDGNPWFCDCNLTPLILWGKKKNTNKKEVWCQKPNQVKWGDIENPAECSPVNKPKNLCKVLFPSDEDARC